MKTVFNVYYVLVHLNLLVWGTFTLVYGITRKWEKTPHGINTFILSCGVTGLFAILVSGIWWRSSPIRVVAVLALTVLFLAAGIQRLSFLRRRKTRDI